MIKHFFFFSHCQQRANKIIHKFSRDKARKTARINCRICLEDYQTTVNVLSDPVDVYNDWIDACDAAN